MSVNKKSLFEPGDILIADFAKALGHPARIAILKELAKRNECICGEIVNVLPLAQSTVSQHLQELKKAGLVQGTISGVKSCYCIHWENFEKVANLFNLAMMEIKEQKIENTCC
jgi:predicted transcriptional regulator